ncbi:hypothetical protein COOONC_07299 [Cooperia oncophora]
MGPAILPLLCIHFLFLDFEILHFFAVSKFGPKGTLPETPPGQIVFRQPLPDILFSLFPEQEWASRLGDYMVLATVICFCLLLVFHQSRAIVARRFMFIGATLYAFRSVTLLITQLPPGYENNAMRCREQVNITFSVFLSRVIEQAIRAGFQEKSHIATLAIRRNHQFAIITMKEGF